MLTFDRYVLDRSIWLEKSIWSNDMIELFDLINLLVWSSISIWLNRVYINFYFISSRTSTLSRSMWFEQLTRLINQIHLNLIRLTAFFMPFDTIQIFAMFCCHNTVIYGKNGQKSPLHKWRPCLKCMVTNHFSPSSDQIFSPDLKF